MRTIKRLRSTRDATVYEGERAILSYQSDPKRYDEPSAFVLQQTGDLGWVRVYQTYNDGSGWRSAVEIPAEVLIAGLEILGYDVKAPESEMTQEQYEQRQGELLEKIEIAQERRDRSEVRRNNLTQHMRYEGALQQAQDDYDAFMNDPAHAAHNGSRV